VLEEFKPDLVLVHGDTTTTFAVSLACFYARIRVGHVEAGLRTWEKWSPYPEEMNRHLTTRLADLHFAPTSKSVANLREDRVAPDTIFRTGNTAIDGLLWMVEHENEREEGVRQLLERVDLRDRRMVLITAHRRESFGPGFERICEALKQLSLNHPDIVFVYPVHLNPNVQGPVNRHLSGLPNFRLLEPLPYDLFVALMQRCDLILTDSGGIQEEAPSLGKPVLVLRESTERPEAVDAGTVLLVGTDKEKIVSQAERLLTDADFHREMSRRHNPYGDGHAAKRIVNAILESHGRTSLYPVPDLD
jgi:UDP-N-acetylglucosamine 2-epimerase (non-hydrolysing)